MQHGSNSWTTGDEELAEAEPVSYLSPRLQNGKIFKRKKEVEAPIIKTHDVTVSSQRRSALERTDEPFERAEFARQNTEREQCRDRKFDRRAAGIS